MDILFILMNQLIYGIFHLLYIFINYLLGKQGIFSFLSVNNYLSGGSKNICWNGYHRVAGTATYSKHSCVKN